MEIIRLNQPDMDYVKAHSISGGNFKLPSEGEWDFCLIDNDKPILIGGISLLTPTTGFCWIDMAEASRDKILTVYRLLVEFMLKLATTHGIRRLECFVDCLFQEGVRLVEHLGFKRESKCENVFDSKPGFRYVKFFGKES